MYRYIGIYILDTIYGWVCLIFQIKVGGILGTSIITRAINYLYDV
jgi:hypothetical protein